LTLGQMQKMSAYSYKPLNAAKREIRLLVLNPARKGKWDNKLQCSLTTTMLNDSSTHQATSYEAVSYCWGETAPSSYILVDGFPLEITNNLDSFLRRKRVRSSKQRLWIDAICINQADNKERTEQVALMSMIYRCATRLVIWLGEQADDS
jgi:Heterokaryon incompatibility protein (HET)